MTRDKRIRSKAELTPPPPADRTQQEASVLTPPLKAAWMDEVTPESDARARVWNALAKTTRSGVVSETVARVDREMAIRALGAPHAPLRGGVLAAGIASAVLLTGVLTFALLTHPRATSHSSMRPRPASAVRTTPEPPPPIAAEPTVSESRGARSTSVPPPPIAAEPTVSESQPQLRAAKHVHSRQAAPVETATPPLAIAAPSSEPAKPDAAAPLDLASDLKLLRSAAKALASDDPVTALQLLDRHAALYPNSPMTKEKTALRIMAACALGRPDAQRDRDAFLRTEQHSPIAERVRHACAELH